METINSFQSTLPVGGATEAELEALKEAEISIHAPRGGSDLARKRFSGLHFTFQSTLPVGGATMINGEDCISLNISIHAPRGGSDRL